MPKAYRVQVGLLVDLTEAAAIFLICIYLRAISKNWLGFQIFGLIVNFIGFFICYHYVHESPRFLADNGRYQSLLLAMRSIASVNGKIVTFNDYVEANSINFEDVKKGEQL